MSALLLSLMVLLVPPKAHQHSGEAEADARARYGVIAEAIAAEAGDDQRLALFMLTAARYESTYARSVHTGRVKGDGGRSWSIFQIMCGKRADSVVPGTKMRARDIVGADAASTARAAKAAAVHFRRHIKVCKGRAVCVFKNYGGVTRTAKGQVLDRIRQRVTTYQRLRARLAKAGS